MYGDIQVERLAAVKLRGLTPDGTKHVPELLKASTDSVVIGNFASAKKVDELNEKRPPLAKVSKLGHTV